MALLWMDSFDIYGTSTTGNNNMLDGVYADINGTGSPSSTQVRTGTYSYHILSTSCSIRRIFGANKSEVGLGMALYMASLPSGAALMPIARFQNNAATGVCAIVVTTTGQIEVRTGEYNGTVRATSAPVLVATAWQHVEVRGLFSSTVGAVEVRVNGQTVLNVSNINTDGPVGGYASQVTFGIGTTGSSNGFYIDDIFAWDTSGSYNNDFIGDKKVYVISPTSDTAEADWTPDSGATGYTQIDEIPPVNTDYIQGTTVGDVSEFGMSNLPSDVTNVLALQFYTKMLKTDAGASSVQMDAVSGASSASGTDRPITTNATVYMDVFEENPDTSSPWTLSGVDAMLTRATRTA